MEEYEEVEIELYEDDYALLFKMAEEKNLTVEELVCELLKDYLDMMDLNDEEPSKDTPSGE